MIPCPVCQGAMITLRSLNLYQCANGKCGHSQDWSLSPGQQPLIGNSRQSRWAEAWRKYNMAESLEDATSARRELDREAAMIGSVVGEG